MKKDKKTFEIEFSKTVWDSVYIEATDLEEAIKKIAEDDDLRSDLGINSHSGDWEMVNLQEV